MHGRGRGPQHAAVAGAKRAADERAGTRKRPSKSAAAVKAIVAQLGVRTTRAAHVAAIIEHGLSSRDVAGLVVAELYGIIDEKDMDGTSAKRHVQVMKALELLSKLVTDDSDGVKNLRLLVTVKGGADKDNAGTGPMSKAAAAAEAAEASKGDG